MNAPIIMLPGLGGSGEDHWQSHWQRADPTIARIAPASWTRPKLEDWIAALERLARAGDRPVLVAHSMACLTIAHWAARGGRARGAFLVGVPDPDRANYPAAAKEFCAPPPGRLPFPALCIASTNDPYGPIDYARSRAAAWGAELIEIGPMGHINPQAGAGPWPEGAQLLREFCRRLR